MCGGERQEGDGVEEDEKRYGTTQYTSNKVQYSTVQYCTTQQGIIQHTVLPVLVFSDLWIVAKHT